MQYKVTKFIQARNIKDASRLEPTATSIELEEPEELTPAIGFHIDTEYSDDDHIDHGI